MDKDHAQLLSRPGGQLGISFGSISTGLPKDIVQQIIKAERIPLARMEEKKGKIEAKKALIGQLSTLAEDIRGYLAKNANGRAFRDLKVDTNDGLVGVTVDKNVANLGNYQFEVKQLARKSSAMSSGFKSRDESYVGVGFIEYSLPNGDTKSVFVDSDNASLDGVAKLINKDKESGLNATVINDGTDSGKPWRLVLSLMETGDESKAEFPYFYFIDGEEDLYLEQERPAQDAVIALDGFDVEVPSNKVDSLIPGVTLDLKKAKPGEEFSINVAEDKEAASGKITELVDKLNAMLAFVRDQNKIDETSDTSKTLGGDIILQTLESRLRSAVFQTIQTTKGPKRFGDLGVTFTRNGVLELDQKKFDAVLAKDYEMVSEILTGRYLKEGGKEKGFMDHLNDSLNKILRFPDGVLSSRKNSMNSKIDAIDRRISQRERLIGQKEKNLKDRFARLESTISRIKNQGAGLGALGAGGANPVQQLG